VPRSYGSCAKTRVKTKSALLTEKSVTEGRKEKKEGGEKSPGAGVEDERGKRKREISRPVSRLQSKNK